MAQLEEKSPSRSRDGQNVADRAEQKRAAEWFGQNERRCVALGGFACGVLAVSRHINYADAFAQSTHLACQLLPADAGHRSEEHTSELQSHSFISYAVFCLKKKNEPPQR